MDRNHLLVTADALIVIRRRRRRRLRCERRECVQKWLLDRKCNRAVANLMKTQLNDTALQSFLRMTPEAFYQLFDNDHSVDTETRHDDTRSHYFTKF